MIVLRQVKAIIIDVDLSAWKYRIALVASPYAVAHKATRTANQANRDDDIHDDNGCN